VKTLLDRHPLLVVVGSGGVGKTTVAAGLGLLSARSGRDTLVMTFDPSERLKDALSVGEEARDRETPVDTDTPGRLDASLLDARRTFDRLVARYAPDRQACTRILENRYYSHLAGRLAGVLEYMAVERLFEVARDERYDRVVLDTPPTRQALDFLEAPDRIVSFLDSGALKIALKPWFDERGRLRATSRLWVVGKSVEAFLDRLVGLGLLQEMAEFFQAFGPLYEGFRRRALEVRQLLRSRRTLFVLVSGPGEETVPETMFFARRLREAGYHLGPVVVNRIHPRLDGIDAPAESSAAGQAWQLLHWLGERDHRGLAQVRSLLPDQSLIKLPLLPEAPTDLRSLEELAGMLQPEAAGAG
jgi:anion-transporting  ArsA/GET3 family ATPase